MIAFVHTVKKLRSKKTNIVMNRIAALFLFSFLSFAGIHAQNCSGQIADDKVIEGIHILRTNAITMVVRGNYSYSIELINDNKGVTATVYSKNGVEFNQDDEIIFMDLSSPAQKLPVHRNGRNGKGRWKSGA